MNKLAKFLAISATIVGLLTGIAYARTVLFVDGGGTGVSTFTQGWLYSSGGTSALTSSTSPTVRTINATSTTATSTLPLLSSTFFNAITSVITNLTTTNFTATNATTTNATTTNLAVTGTATTTFTGGIRALTARFDALNAVSCDLKADTNGNVSCGTDATGGGGGSGAPASTTATFIIYKSGSNYASYNASTTVVTTNANFSTLLQATVNIIDADSSGGTIYIAEGTYYNSATTTVQGNNTGYWTPAGAVRIMGAGVGATKIVTTNNSDFLAFDRVALPMVSDLTVYLQGSSHALYADSSDNAVRSMWMFYFANMQITSTGTPTGVPIQFGNSLRGLFSNIEFTNTAGCAKFIAEGGWNAGDFTFTRSFCELATTANLNAFEFSSTTNGYMNQVSFDMVEGIGTGVGQTFIKSSPVKFSKFDNLNAEQFDTLVDGYNVTTMNDFIFNYATHRTGISGLRGCRFGNTLNGVKGLATMNKCSFKFLENDADYAVVDDMNTDPTRPNIISGFIGSDAGTASASTSATTLTLYRDISFYGTLDNNLAPSGLAGVFQTYGAMQVRSSKTASSSIRSDATSTFQTGINISTGCFAIGGTCLSTGGTPAWGSITGTLSSQTDLQNALNLKLSTSSLDSLAKGYFFSTTSADYWKTTNNFFSSTSADFWDTTKGRWSTTSQAYWASLNDFATTSVNYWYTLQSKASSTLLSDSNTFTGINTINNLTMVRSTTTNATTTGAQNVGSLTIGTLTGLLKGVSGAVTTATAGTDYENPLTFTAPLFRAVNAISWFGLSTTSQPASSNLLVSNGTNGVFGVATNTASCSGNTSCSSFTIIGGSPVTISSTGGGSGLSTSSPTANNQVLVYNSAGAGSAYSVATTSATINNGLTGLLTTLNTGGTQTIGLATINAGVLGAQANGSVPSSLATSSLYLGTDGQVLTRLNGVWVGSATTTFSGLLAYSGGNVTCPTCVANTRSILTTYPVTGGGDLSADRTIALAFGTTTNNNWSGLNVFQGASTTFVGSVSMGNATMTNATTTRLAVTGNATSTFGNGINLTTGCVTYNGGACVGASGGSGTVNSGTLNQVAYYQSAGTAVSGTSTLVLQNTESVAIQGTGFSASSNARLNIRIGSIGQAFQAIGEIITDVFNCVLVTGDGFCRYSVLADGTMKWGSGSASGDVGLARSGVGLLNFGFYGGATSVKVGIGSTTAGTSFAIGTGANFINLNESGTSTYSSGIVAGGGGLHLTNGGLRVASLNTASCDVKADTNGVFFCGTDATGGGGGGSGIGWTWNSINSLRMTTTTDDVLVGASATSSVAKVEVIKNGLLAWFASTTGATIRPIFTVFRESTYGESGIGINSSSTEDAFTINGTANFDPMIMGCDLISSGGNITSDQLAGQICGGLGFDSVTDGGILQDTAERGIEANMPIHTIIRTGDTASWAPNEGGWLKTNKAIPATTTIIMEAWLRNPNTNVATTTGTYVFGLGNVGINSLTTTSAYTAPTNTCSFQASSTANWIAVVRKASVYNAWDNTGVSTSSTQSTFRRFRIQQDLVNGCLFFVDGVLVASEPAVNTPVVPMQLVLGLGNNGAGTGTIGTTQNHYFNFAELKMGWGRWQQK